MKSSLKFCIGIGILIILATTITLIKLSPLKQDYESCVETCENSGNTWYSDINCTEYCNCISNESYTDVCIDFRAGKPDISNKIKISTEEAVEIAKSTSEVQEFLHSGEANSIPGVLVWEPYNCVQKICSYKYIVDYSNNINGKIVFSGSKELGPVVIIEIDASTGEIIGKYSQLKDIEDFKTNCIRIYGSGLCE